MDPFMNKGDQLDQGEKVEVESLWWTYFNRKIRPNKTTKCQIDTQLDPRSNEEKENFEVDKLWWIFFAMK